MFFDKFICLCPRLFASIDTVIYKSNSCLSSIDDTTIDIDGGTCVVVATLISLPASGCAIIAMSQSPQMTTTTVVTLLVYFSLSLSMPIVTTVVVVAVLNNSNRWRRWLQFIETISFLLQ